jgi:hypothetical protein
MMQDLKAAPHSPPPPHLPVISGDRRSSFQMRAVQSPSVKKYLTENGFLGGYFHIHWRFD